MRALPARLVLMPCRSGPVRCRVRWHMGSVGTEVDMHNLHLHGNTFLK